MKPSLLLAIVFCAVSLFMAAASRADDSEPAAYAKFVDGAQTQTGLFNIIHKSGKVYIEIAPAQFGKDFVQTSELVNGLGGWDTIPGGINSYARIIRFTKSDLKVVVTWPNMFFQAPNNEPAQRAIQHSVANSTVAVAPIAALDAVTGHVVFDASFLLGDITNLNAQLKQVTGSDNPEQEYHLDPDRTVFGPTKAFPLNVILDADQTWASEDPKVVDNVPDPRSLQFRIAYNISQPPNDGDYMPRLADDRVGYFDAAVLDFASDRNFSRVVRRVVRWNMQPSDPTKAISPAKHPMVYYLSNNIPLGYREPVRRGLLDWNAAFAKIGISDAIQVKDQPDDPNWDQDDIRYNTVLWLTQSNGGGYAAENPVWDPRTGQMFRTNIVVDADVVNYSNMTWDYQVEPTNAGTGNKFFANDRAYARGKREQAAFGKIALEIMGRPLTGGGLTRYNDELLESFVVHEAGHGFGLQHNFIGSTAYTAKQLQSLDFTRRHGVATSVMEYAGLNLWPKGYGQGTYWQTVLGPYDYYVIKWGYGRIAGARSPEAEVPILNRLASVWSNPLYRFASDEDVAYSSAHAIDPRVAQWDFTDEPLAWDETQLKLTHELMATLDRRWPKYGHTYDEERAAFGVILGDQIRTSTQPEHYIGGELLSRAHQGDPAAPPPLVQVPRAQEQRAFGLLDKYLFSDGAWNFSPQTLNRLVYSEWETQQGGTWAYDPQPRHDIPVAEIAEGVQRRELTIMFQPLMLERLNDLSLKAKPGSTMSLVDLFNWTQAAVFGDLRDPKLTGIGEVHRSLQQWYVRMLARLWISPAPDTPYDAQSLARAQLSSLRKDIKTALGRRGLDQMTRVHLEALHDAVSRPLDARQLITTK